MKETIKLNSGTNIDLSKLIESKLLVQANSGGGKSWALRRILEQSHGKVQHIILDSEGEFGTLREKYDYVLAGKGGDTPAEPRSAALLARKLLELQVSAIIDLYELHPQERKRFVRLFLDALVNAPKELWHPVIIVIDEAHTFAPEKGQSEAMDAVIGLAALGRKRGFGVILATQRISKLNKDAAAECNNKLIGRASMDIDMKRAADELGFTGREQILSLRALKPGEFYAFGPAISDDVQKVTVGTVATTHPKAGSRSLTKVVPPTDAIKKVLGQLADLPHEAEKEARTVGEFQTRVRQLEAEKRALERQPGKPDQGAIERAVAAAQQQKDREFAMERRTQAAEIARLSKTLAQIGKLVGAEPPPITARVENAPQPRPTAPAPTPPTITTPVLDADGSITAPRQRILDALAWLESLDVLQAEKAQLGVLADQSPRSSGYTNNLGALRSAGLISYPTPGLIALTEQGRALASAPSAPLSSEDIHESIRRKISRPQWAILEALIADYPADLSKQELAECSGQSFTSSGYTNNLGALRSLGFLDYPIPGRVRARDILFV